MIKKNLAFAAVVAGVMTAVAACGSDATSSPAASSAPASAGPVTGSISYESWTPTDKTMAAVVAGFEKANPGVKVSTKLEPFADYQTSLKTQLASGGGPDVFVVAPGAFLEQFKSFVEPVDGYAKASLGDNWAATYRPTALERVRSGGQTLGLPAGYTVAGLMWVNKTLLERNGLQVPKTYDELKSVSAALRAKDLSALALGAKDAWQNVDYFMAVANGSAKDQLYGALDGSGKWTDPALVNAFGNWKKLFDDGVLQKGALGTTTYNDTYDLWLAQKAAFLANGSWNMDMFVNSADKIGKFEAAVVGLPVPGASGSAPVTGDVNSIIAVNKNSKNKAAAYKLAEYMSQGAGGQVLNDAFLDFPVTTKAFEPTVKLTPNAQAVRKDIQVLLENNLAGYRSVPKPDVNDALGKALAAVAAGSLSPQAAAEQVQQAADGD